MPLFLLPNVLGDLRDHSSFFPISVDAAVAQLDGLIAESEGGGRSFLKRFQTKKRAHEIPIALLNKNTPFDHVDFYLEPARKGETWGVVSDAGLPCLADPGASLVLRARQLQIPVEAFVGPSSIIFALMQSGLSGQKFTFHGYIAKEPIQRQKELAEWERLSKRERMTQIFIETPFRNNHALQSCLETLNDKTLLSIAWDLTLPSQCIQTDPVFIWKKKTLPDLSKVPAVFLFANYS